MKKLLLILILILPVTSFAADLKLFQKIYVVDKIVKNAAEAVTLFNNEKVLAEEKLGDYDYQTVIRELPDGTFRVKFIFKKKGK